MSGSADVRSAVGGIFSGGASDIRRSSTLFVSTHYSTVKEQSTCICMQDFLFLDIQEGDII